MKKSEARRTEPLAERAGRERVGNAASAGAAFLLAQLGAHAAMKFAERVSSLRLTPPHAGILRAVRLSEGMSQKALGARLGVVPSRLVELLDELGQRGLVERREDRNDRRVYALYLTKKGTVAFESLGRVARAHQESLLAALSSAERARLSALLGKVAAEQGLVPGVHPGYARLAPKRVKSAPADKARLRGSSRRRTRSIASGSTH